ncbi:MAG TPA: M23 family metallopeptidase [Syntrophomonadaceae bacterium]|nr:M23 family metallopeptidase [Syntrophomonadaceae bacterium]HQA06601.1 M23 family metallopeptidase [Syntrophomonadaceae bacterium]HQE22326.1 M23 family metallopeptidase [Syntrophomonadaceae bacterium]
MYKRWVGSLVLGVLCTGILAAPVWAGLNQGNFIPAGGSRAVAVDSQVRYYQVQKGDTLWDISRSFNVDIQTLTSINNLNRNSILKIGQTLQIPGSGQRLHVIRPGETMWDIAARYKVSLTSLKAANPSKNPVNLKINDQLVIPSSTYQVAQVTQQPSRGWTYTSLFNWPLVGTITSGYGWRQSGYHHGIDIAGEIGDPIKACAAGTVTFAGYKSVYGRTVVIEHPDGKETLYAHVQTIKVSQGESVARGQVIATVGMTGRTTGPHVHLEVRNNGELCNPLNYLSR